ncbi:MAG: phosphatase PAP2 family protein [Pseudomonadota bacterium]
MQLKTPFAAFAGFAILYHLSAILLAYFGFGIALGNVDNLTQPAILFERVLRSSIFLLIAFFLVLIYYWRSVSVVEGLLALVAISIFTPGFSIFKSLMPFAMPFYADPYLADLDWFFNLGMDGYERLDNAGLVPSAKIMALFYGPIWLTASLVLPIFIGLFDPNKNRRWRFVSMLLVSWVVLGNLVALLGLSVGPIYYERVYDDPRFAPFLDFFNSAGLADTFVDDTQDFLWQMHAAGTPWIGTGISAFPSVHVAIATTAALYAFDVHRWLGLIGFAFVAIIQVLSVATGYHYALDGYFSILFISLFWLWHKKQFTPDKPV